MSRDLGQLRRSQVVTTFGPGSIVDFRVGGYRGAAVSAVVAGLEQWDDSATSPGLNHPQQISEPRLQRKLQVDGFRLPPVQPDERKQIDVLAGIRFPRWLQCPRCDRLAPERRAGYWRAEPADPRLSCPGCTTGRRAGKVYAVPVRLVTACDRGHLDEFPWEWWVHRQPIDHEARLFLESGKGSGIGSLFVRCETCHKSASLAGSFGDNAIPIGCKGKRPWIGVPESCDQNLRAVQRGASNLYFALLESALSIPPWSDSIQRRLGIHWAKLASKETTAERRLLVELLDLDDELEMSATQVVDLVEDRMERLDAAADIRMEEYSTLIEGSTGRLEQDVDFEIEEETVLGSLRGKVETLRRVTRLREVRALRGFTRLEPWASEDDDRRIARLSAAPMRWLPAIDIRGEGIFLSLDTAALTRWEMSPPVRDRMAALRRRAPSNPSPPTGREVLLHTLAHCLMSELSLACGYSQASLRERLYVGPEMAGVLIYTASPDSDGTLGGLVRQGEAARFSDIFATALERTRWCANDPLCADGRLSLSEVHSLGSCYACILVPETSCELFNRRLDRGMLIGTPAEASLGFFGS